MAYIHAMRGDFKDAKYCIERALALAVQLENPVQSAFSQAVHGWLTGLEGDTERAYAELAAAYAFRDQAGRSWHSAYPPIFLASLSQMADARTEARAAAWEAIALAEESGDPQALRWASCVMAELDILDGRPGEAEARLLPLRDRPGLRECDVTRFLPVLAWAMLEQGRVAEAAAVVEQALARAKPEQMRLVLVEALRVQALVARAQGHLEEAARSVEEGIALGHDMPHPYAEARLLHLAGLLCAERGDADAARTRFAAASALFAALQVPPADHVAAGGTGPAMPRTERQAWALARMRTHGPLSPGVYAAALGVSTDTALRDLHDLVQRGAVVAQGTTRDRQYVLPTSSG
jgi:ATP/maltotriose-dependent transcriptional regulator MalT